MNEIETEGVLLTTPTIMKLSKFKECSRNFSKVFYYAEEELPLRKIVNSVKKRCKVENDNCFRNEASMIIDYITEHQCKKLFIALPNENLKYVCAEFKKLESINIYIIPEHIYPLSQELSINDIAIRIDHKLPRLKMLQINVTQHCNLNCRGCANYSNLVINPTYNNLDTVRRDLQRIKKMFWGIETLKLMGGEPLLNNEIGEYVVKSAEIFPDANIQVATNGILIDSINEAIYDSIRKVGAELVVSLYPSTMLRKKDIDNTLKREKVRYKIFEFEHSFFKYLSDKPTSSPAEGYSNCPARECHCLEDGLLAVCGRPLYLHRLNELPVRYKYRNS